MEMTLRLNQLVPLFLVFFLLFSVSLTVRSSSNGSIEKEKTLAMIKPDGLLGNHTDEIKKVIFDSGFEIIKEITVQLDEDRAASFYAEHSLKSFFPSLIKYMTSIRAMCGLDSEKNCVHGSDSPLSSTREISFFFQEMSSGEDVMKHDEL
ncbi:probable nucleoside diphosphate kinase 5 isoform X3 [Malania oleifera]|uniref:probable nucleoside diphosphate kinase 5 isoform X3 n=1 Tax=Malania oleifera TaxID=397392 RepID=UPI0025AE8F82|nr:probable nucleoside diphosphate kinase 5 isoform X3 [Malania oleifera]XP_057977489.1 probable nucleoside diphosphate kinase 5 isoform X3 [Malania oleifera]XP_057977490.1 probable nucleoside diphosphate kinase 5 isoform X3 [Malania oleifera]XP_057977491.1 probable nucleoside diphosphate kinase 5 isoform X3 [Malania oleifera]